MSRIAYAQQGETLDAVLHRVYGRTAGVTEQTLELNQALAEHGPVLPEGTAVVLPPPPGSRTTRKPKIQLWS